MAINIFNGANGSKGKSKPKTSGVVQTETGKKSTNVLSNIVSKVGGFAEKFGGLIPGVGGIVSKVGGLLSKNDPEWWQNVPGTGISTNQPLAPLTEQVVSPDGSTFKVAKASTNRVGILEFTTHQGWREDYSSPKTLQGIVPVIEPTASEITTYLMQNVRKVVNAVPLQSPEAYRAVFMVQATAYALKHQLDKLIVLSTHSMPYLPSFTDGSYEILNAASYSQLVGMRDRLAEYCKASVRLPHTLCQYLAWRYGRVYKARRTAKSTLVLYNVIPLEANVSVYQQFVNSLLGYVASPESKLYPDHLDFTVTPTEKQAAQSDLFNAYMNHVVDVPIPLDTQFIFDPKEFVLRTNLDPLPSGDNNFVSWIDYSSDIPSIKACQATLIRPDPEMVYMDSDLDNKTTFMASTVSTNSNFDHVALFPVRQTYFHYAGPVMVGTYELTDSNVHFGETDTYIHSPYVKTSGSWTYIYVGVFTGRAYIQGIQTLSNTEVFKTWLVCLAAALSCDFYNAEIYNLNFTDQATGSYIDMTAPSFDLGRIENAILENTQVYAFANLVYDGVTSYAAKEMPKAINEAESTLKEVVETAVPTVTVSNK